jgi:opacity protein-like surface antigen
MLRIGWEPPFGGYLEERVRTLVNQTYGEYPYRHYLDVTVRYSRPWNDITVGGEVLAGRDVFGKSFSQLSGFVRYGGPQRTRDYDADDEDDGAEGAKAASGDPGSELFVDAGVNANQVKINLEEGLPMQTTKVMFGPHVGIGARRAVTDNADLGVRLEADQVDDHTLIGVRPVDYRYRFGESFAISLFAGVNRYNLATPALSLYGGAGAQWRNVISQWDLGVDYRYAQNIARNHVLPTDIQGPRPDSFYKIQSVVAYLSRHF